MGGFNIKNKTIIILFILLLLTIVSSVSATSNDTLTANDDSAVTDSVSHDESAQKTIDNPSIKESKNLKTASNKHNSKIKVADATVTYSDKALLKATIVDKTANKYITSGKVLFKINGVSIGYSNIEKGKASMLYDTKNLTAKKYNISVVYGGTKSINGYRSNATLKVNKMPTVITLNNVNAKTNTSCVITALVKDKKGAKVNGGFVLFKVNGLSLSQVKVVNGVASLKYTPLNVVRNYTITAKYSGTSRYAYSSRDSKLLVTLKVGVLNWASKGNIKANTVLYRNLTKSSITNDLVNAALSGTPYVCLGNGKGNVVFIVSGIHGSELSSQSACVKLINDLSTKNLHGTVYIIPFVAPSYTGNNTRNLNNVNLNSVANKKGTISNNVYNLAKSKKAVSLGDFHCTQPGGEPGRDAVFGTSKPTAASATLAKYIAGKTGSSAIVYAKAGSEYQGALEDYCNMHSLTSVTCEVKTAHGSIAKGSVEKSYKMMKSFLAYYKII